MWREMVRGAHLLDALVPLRLVFGDLLLLIPEARERPSKGTGRHKQGGTPGGHQLNRGLGYARRPQERERDREDEEREREREVERGGDRQKASDRLLG